MIGTFCVYDNIPRTFDERDRELLTTLADEAMDQLTIRRRLRGVRTMPDVRYGFEGLPLEPIRWTTVLLAGPSHAGTRDLGLRMIFRPSNEGVVVVTTNRRSSGSPTTVKGRSLAVA